MNVLIEYCQGMSLHFTRLLLSPKRQANRAKNLQFTCMGLSCHLSVTSLCSHSFETRELRFGTQTAHLNATKLA